MRRNGRLAWSSCEPLRAADDVGEITHQAMILDSRRGLDAGRDIHHVGGEIAHRRSDIGRRQSAGENYQSPGSGAANFGGEIVPRKSLSSSAELIDGFRVEHD